MMDLRIASFRLILILASSASFTRSTFVEDKRNQSHNENNIRGGWGMGGGVWGSSGIAPTKFGSNVCYVQQSDGCRFRITVFPDECRGGGGGGYDGREARNAGIGKRDLNEIEPNAAEEDAAKSLLKLDAFEQKLTKMMEDLSVRSLRHVREIRSDLRQMTLSMNRLKTGNDATSGGGGGAADGRGGFLHQSPRQCPSQFIGMGNWKACYRFSNFEATWNEAQEYCKIFGASLLSLDTMKECSIIDYFMKSNAEFQESKGWWTGGSYISRSRRWMWTSGQSIHQPINFTRWASGQPPTSMTTTHCIALFRSAKYYWHAAPCTDRHNFICQLNSA